MINTEINNQQAALIKECRKSKNYIFVEKSYLDGTDFEYGTLKEISAVAFYVTQNFNLIQQTKYFKVYNSLKTQ